MAIVLYRVDERLIHGQVVVGWGAKLHPDVILVVDDELAAAEWEQELYCMGLPPGVSTRFATVERARTELPALQLDATRTMLLTRDLATMRRLGEGGELLRGVEVNVGGIHHAPGRMRVLPYVYLSDDERRDIRALGDAGALVSARDLPGTRRVGAADLLRAGRP